MRSLVLSSPPKPPSIDGLFSHVSKIENQINIVNTSKAANGDFPAAAASDKLFTTKQLTVIKGGV